MSSSLATSSGGADSPAPRGWMHLPLRLNEPSRDRDSRPEPPDLRKIETLRIEEGAFEIAGSNGSASLWLAAPAHTGSLQKLSLGLEEAYHGNVYAGEDEVHCPFSRIDPRRSLHFIAGRNPMPSYHLVDIGGWTHDMAPHLRPPREWDLSIPLYRNLEAWSRLHPSADFVLDFLFVHTGVRERSLSQTLFSPEDKTALRARGWAKDGPLGLYGYQPPTKGFEPTQLDMDYHSRYTLRLSWPIFYTLGIQAAVTDDPAGFCDVLNGWASSIRWRTRGGSGPLFTFREMGCGLLQGEKGRREAYLEWLRAFGVHSFLPGTRRKGYGGMTSRELFRDLPVSWEKRLSLLSGSYEMGGTPVHPAEVAQAWPHREQLVPRPPAVPSYPLPKPPRETTSSLPLEGGERTRQDTASRFEELRRAQGLVSHPSSSPGAPAKVQLSPVGLGRSQATGKGCVVGHSDREKRSIVFPEDPGNTLLEGQTQMGKSTLAHNLLLHQYRNSPPSTRFVMVEAHGTFAQDLKGSLTPEEAREVIEIDLAPDSFLFKEDGVQKVLVPFNVLHIPDRENLSEGAFAHQRDLIIGDLIFLLKALRVPSRNEDASVVGQRMEHVYRSLLPGLMERPDTNLYDLYLLLLKNRQVMESFSGMVRSVASRSYLEELKKASPDYLLSSQNPIGSIVNNSILSGALCQRMDVVTFKDLLSKHRMIIINLNKGKVGWEQSRLLGAAFIAQLGFLALQGKRSDRPSLYLFVDEWHNFVSRTFSTMLSEGAKYGLRLVLANQYLNQIPEEILDAVTQNVATWAFFRLGPGDARMAAEISRSEHFGTPPDDFYRFPKGYAGFRIGAEFVAGSTLPPPPPMPPETRKLVEKIILDNTRQYATEESSQCSPYLIDERHMSAILRALAVKPGSVEDLVKIVPFRRAEIWEAVLRCRQLGYLTYDRQRGVNAITPLGQEFLSGMKTRHVSGAEKGRHVSLRVRFKQYLSTKGVQVSLVDQGNSYEPLADAIATLGGETCHIEVECSTLESRSPQLLQNLQKAMDAGRRCIFVVASRERAAELGAFFAEKAPTRQMEVDYVIMYEEGEGFCQHPGREHGIPSFHGPAPMPTCFPNPPGTVPHEEGRDETEETGPVVESTPPETPAANGTAQPAPKGLPPMGHSMGKRKRMIVRTLLQAVDDLESEGRTVVHGNRSTIRGSDLIAKATAQAPDLRDEFTPHQVGALMSQLGFDSKRIREEEARVTLYFLDTPSRRPE